MKKAIIISLVALSLSLPVHAYSAGFFGGSTAPYTSSPELSAIAGTASAADKCIMFTGAGTASVFSCTSYGRGMLGMTDEAAIKAAMNAEAGVDFQAYDLDLTAWASKTVTATQAELNYVAGLTSAVQTQINGKQPLDSDLTAIAALSTTSFGRGLLGYSDAASLTSALGLIKVTARGTATLSGLSTVVNEAATTVGSIILLTSQAGTLNVGILSITARSAGASFTVASTNVLDGRTVGYAIVEP